MRASEGSTFDPRTFDQPLAGADVSRSSSPSSFASSAGAPLASAMLAHARRAWSERSSMDLERETSLCVLMAVRSIRSLALSRMA
eukprot:5423459-Prymnesium_polylepis.2